jgi:hypothetical protein
VAVADEVVDPVMYIDTYTLPRGGLNDVARILQSQGRELAAKRNVTKATGVPFKTGKRAGEVRPDKYKTNWSLATVDREFPVVLAVWLDSTLSYARVRTKAGEERWFDGVNQLKAWLKGEVDDTPPGD